MENDKPIKQSRWVKKSKVDRYDKRTLEFFGHQYVEPQGWYRGAKVQRVKSK
jgi:hypothetical protein